MEQSSSINYVERRDFLLARRELNKKKRLESKSKHVSPYKLKPYVNETAPFEVIGNMYENPELLK